MGVAEWPIAVHIIVGTAATWILGRLHVNAILVVLVMVLYFYNVHVVYAQRLKGQQRKELRNEFLLESVSLHFPPPCLPAVLSSSLMPPCLLWGSR